MTFSLIAAAALANALLIGLIPTLLDGLTPMLKARLAPAERAVDWYTRLFYVAWIPAMPLAGWLLDYAPNREVLLYGGLIPLILGLAWLALTRNPASLMLNAVFLGAAYSVLTTATIRLMSVAFFPDYISEYPLNIASLNLGFVAVGAGAMLGPLVVWSVEKWCGSRQGLLYLSIALLVPAALTALCERPLFPTSLQTEASWDTVFARPHLLMIAAMMMIYFALENSLEFWPEAYLKELGYSGGGLQGALYTFWFAFIGSRAAAAWWLYEHPTHGPVLTLILIGTSALILGNLAGGFEIGSGSCGFWLLGLCYGPLLPGFLGIALDLYPQSKPLAGIVLGVLLALSGFDTLIARPVLGWFTRDRRARSVMYAPLVLALIAGAVLLVLRFIP